MILIIGTKVRGTTLIAQFKTVPLDFLNAEYVLPTFSAVCSKVYIIYLLLLAFTCRQLSERFGYFSLYQCNFYLIVVFNDTLFRINSQAVCRL